MTDFDSIWRTQDEIRTVVNAVQGALGFAATTGTQECLWNLAYDERRMASVMTIIENMPCFLVEKVQFLPKLLVLGCILDNFTCFLPRLLDYFYNFAPIRHKKR